MALVRRGTCEITALNAKGLGTGIENISSEIVEIPYTIPSEIVAFEKHSYRNKSSFILSEILKKSENRVNPPCKYFGTCGGCSLQHLESAYYQKYKLENLQQILSNYNINCNISSIKFIGSASRRRAIFESVKKQDQIFFGFKKFHSDKIVNIDSCLLLIPELSSLIEKLKIILFQFLENKEKCKILITKADNGIDLIIETNNYGSISEEKAKILKNFAINNGIIKLTIINNNKWNLLYFQEQPYILLAGVKVSIDNHSFLQVSSLSDHILTELINNIFNEIKTSNRLQIVDLFCGRGTLTIPASKFGVVDGFESEKSSVKVLSTAISQTKLEANIVQRDLFTKPLTWDELNKYDVAIINPPRTGAKEQTVLLATSTVKTIIYLSCNPESFGRDAEIILRKNRYKIEIITPIDQFYWSHHLEILAVFKLIDPL